MKKYILTNQMKNEYFQENEKKSIEITREMILFHDPNEIVERKSKTEGKWLQIEDRTRIRNTKKMTLFDDENTKLIIIFIYEGYGVKNRAWTFQNHEGDIFPQMKRKYWGKWFKRTSWMTSFVKKKTTFSR